MPIKYYQRIISLLPDPTLVVTPSGKILAFNLGAATLFNISDSINCSLFDALNLDTHKDTHKDTLVYLRQCARSKQPVIGSLRLKPRYQKHALTCYGAMLEPRSTDNEAVMLLRLVPQSESSAKFLILQKQIDDLNKQISRRLKAEHEFKNQSTRLEVTLKSIGDAVIITDEKTYITFLNPVAEALTGWQLQQALGRPVADIFVVVNEHNGQILENPVKKAMFSRKVIPSDTDTMLIPKYGECINIETTSAPIELDEIIEGAITVFHDVTEKRALERQLIERASRLELMNHRKNQFLTMLAHELRSPVSPISNATQLLKLKAQTTTIFKEPIQVIERQVNHLKRLIDDMLDVSRITSGKMKIIKENMDFVSLIRSVCNDYSPQFNQAEIECITELPSTSIWLHADADRLTQVMHNVFNNSLKFTPQGGTITVSLSVLEDSITLEITDTGIGIEKNALPDLFEPFTQADQTLERSRGGLGLGLSLVKGIVDLHNGSVSASSDGADQGSIISITLPFDHIKPVVEAETVVDKPTQLHRILLIEDDLDAANMLSQLLELLGHEVFCSSTGPDGIEKATTLKPSLIICDIGLPGLDGFAVAQQLRGNTITSSIPLVALTGYGESEFVNRAKEAGFDRHITKPANLKDIQAALALTR